MTTSEVRFCQRPSLAISAALTLILVLLLAPVIAVAQTEARVYQLNNRSADDVAGQIRELYQNAPVTVTARGQQSGGPGRSAPA